MLAGSVVALIQIFNVSILELVSASQISTVGQSALPKSWSSLFLIQAGTGTAGACNMLTKKLSHCMSSFYQFVSICYSNFTPLSWHKIESFYSLFQFPTVTSFSISMELLMFSKSSWGMKNVRLLESKISCIKSRYF